MGFPANRCLIEGKLHSCLKKTKQMTDPVIGVLRVAARQGQLRALTLVMALKIPQEKSGKNGNMFMGVVTHFGAVIFQ